MIGAVIFGEAIRSALAQRCQERPQVIIVEGFGPDAGLRDSVLSEFASQMWFNIAFTHGSAATNRVVPIYREHHSIGRGTTAVNISGRKYAYLKMQHKRHIPWLRQKNLIYGLIDERY